MVYSRVLEAVREVYSSAPDHQAALSALISLLSSLRANGDEDGAVFVADEAATRAAVLRQFETAAQLWGEACALRPGDTLLLFNLAYALERCGRVQDSIAALERCASMQDEGDPEHSLPVADKLRKLRGQ